MGHLTLTLTLLSLSACLLGAASAPLGATTTTGMVSYSVPQATADAFGAKQLNGDAPIYELRRNSSSSKWVLFLEGGGWCFGNTTAATIASCASRAGFKPITAGTHELDTQPVTDTPDYGGVLGSDCSTNPGFCEWNAVFLHYRDGASFGSNRTDPIAVNFANGSSGAELWMRGRPSFDALVHDLQHSHGMAQATEVILSGGSAGGLAVLYNLDHLADLLGGAVRLTGFPDAGFFLDAPNTQGEFVYRANFQGADPVWNVTGARGTNEGCLAANTVEKWKCLMAPYIAMYLKTPIYVMNSAYDAYQLPNILQTPCPVSTVQHPCNDTAAQEYGKQLKVIAQDSLGHNPENGMYIDSCYVHEQNVNYCSTQGAPNCVGWNPDETGSKKWGYSTAVPSDSSGARLTPQQAFSAYYFHGQHAVLVDAEALQQNPSCVYHTL